MKISVVVHRDRSYVGTLSVGGFECPLSAQAHHTMHDVVAGQYHPTLAIGMSSEHALRAELGPKVLMFQSPLTGRTLALHAALTDFGGAFYPSDGSLCVGHEDILFLASRLKKSKKPVVLTVSEVPVGGRTKLIGARVSDETIPMIPTLRALALQRGVSENIWKWFAEHHASLGCTTCHKW